MALLHSKGNLRIGETFIHESILGSRFTGRLIAETKVANYDAVIPEITGRAYVTDFNALVLEDLLREGFLL